MLPWYTGDCYEDMNVVGYILISYTPCYEETSLQDFLKVLEEMFYSLLLIYETGLNRIYQCVTRRGE